VGAHSDYKLPFFKLYPVVISDKVILPSVTLPLRAELPASLRTLEKALTTDGIIFLVGSDKTLKENSIPDECSKVGTLCRVSRKLLPSAGGGDLVTEGFLLNGLERATVVRFIESDGFLSAEVFYDPSPDLVPDERRLKKLKQKVRELLGELHSLLPKEDKPWWKSLYSQDTSVSSKLEKLFNVQDISSPSRLADHTAFLLYLLDLISTKQQRMILEIFRSDQRLEMLFKILAEAVEKRQLGKLNQLLMQKARRTGKHEIKKTIDAVLSNRKDGRPPTGPLGGKNVEPLLYDQSQKEVASTLGVTTRQVRAWATEYYGGWKKAQKYVRSRPRTDFPELPS
jgi:ATP-dependent Lon protease